MLIIIVLLVTAIFATISVTISNKETEAPELVSTSMSHIKAKNISNEGLHYAIKQIVQDKVSLVQTETTLSYSGFDVLDGTIDSIRYVKNTTGDTLTITCYASAIINGQVKNYDSSALVVYTPGSSHKAFNCSKTVTLRGNAVINGGLDENATLDFQTTFGMTMAQMKANADHYYRNPRNSISPISGITYVELSGNKSLHMSGHWTGSGILIVDGNFKDTGQANFNGIIWVNDGYFQASGNSEINGAVFVDTDPGDTVKMSGNSEVNYDETIVTNLIGSQSSSSGSVIEILSWDN
jgi:hypothetical protein